MVSNDQVAKDQDLTVREGENLSVKFKVTRDGAPRNLSTADEVLFRVTSSPKSETAILEVVTTTFVDDDGTKDAAVVTATPSTVDNAFASRGPGRYYLELRVTETPDVDSDVVSVGRFIRKASSTG